MPGTDCVLCVEQIGGSRQGEGHIAVRFGDHDFRVLIDGLDVSHGAFEAMAGDTGFVLVYPETKRLCPSNRQHAFAVRLSGRVEISKSSPLTLG